MIHPIRLVLLIVLVATGCAGPTAEGDPEYLDEIEAWKTRRHERLQSPDGWLTLAGFHWLQNGENLFGTAADNDIVLPAETAPPHVGVISVDGGTITVRAIADAGLTLDGEPVGEREISADGTGRPDVLHVGDLMLHVIKRDDRYAVRVRNPNSPVRAGFTGLDYFPVDPAFRVQADFVAYDEPRQIQVPNVLGYAVAMTAPGRAEFTLHGQSVTLVPVLNSPDSQDLFFIFSDGTSGKETYGAGRFLYTPLPEGGVVDLDFNKAYNPPCVFTPYATCPTPPAENRLDVRIEAGEKSYRGH